MRKEVGMSRSGRKYRVYPIVTFWVVFKKMMVPKKRLGGGSEEMHNGFGKCVGGGGGGWGGGFPKAVQRFIRKGKEKSRGFQNLLA